MRAIISVFDKTGVVEFAQALANLGVELISSGGTYSLLRAQGIEVKQVSDITGFAECLDGRVKTLHPKIHGGILADRSKGTHMHTIEALGIPEIDLVVVNLYPFKSTISNHSHTFVDAIENIDIGGPTMIRSAAKNHAHVLVVTDAQDYGAVIAALKSAKLQAKEINPAFRLQLAQKAFSTTAQYDIMIANYLEKCEADSNAGENPKYAQRVCQSSEAPLNTAENKQLPDTILLALQKKQDLRYGENPHQAAAYYTCDTIAAQGVESAEILHGKELSYNNYNDAQGAIDLAMEFSEPVCVAVKHATPCAAATAENICEAYEVAYACDPVSIFGGIICLNRPVDAQTAQAMHKIFLEVIIAPHFEAEALAILTQKQNLRLLKLPMLGKPVKDKSVEYKAIGGGFLVQERNRIIFNEETEKNFKAEALSRSTEAGDTINSITKGNCKVATKIVPTEAQIKDLDFAMKVVKHVKSNAIVIAKDGRTLGIGGGQVSRIWAAEQALERAGAAAEGAVLASDAFFPFSDVVHLAAQKGIAAIIQPGGSIKDQDSIEACDENNMAMILTGIRHFRH